MQFRLAAVAPANRADWLAGWCARFNREDGLSLCPIVLHADGEDDACETGGADAAALLARHPDAPFEATLVLVDAPTMPWARAALSAIGSCCGPISLITRALRPSSVRELLARGAHDFIPCDGGREEIKLRLWRLLSGTASKRAGRSAAERRPLGVSAPQARHPKLAGLIGTSPAFVEQLDRLPRLAGCDAGVLILGETGTGKDLFAQAVHYLSPRADHPCVAVNCGALPPDLVEAELFGHARGAFTSAHENRVGLVALAERGTLFLDEVDTLPPLAQVKLLRFLQDKQYRPVGGARPQQADVRIVAASNGDLAGLCERGSFRTDLYYRLNVLTLQLPALRDRNADVLTLAQHFVGCYARRFDRPVSGLDAGARARITAYAWPGNVRELEHAIERGVLMAEGELLGAADLGLPGAAPSAAAGACPIESFQAAKARVVEQFERRYIEDALASCDGNITHAADAVSKNRRAFWQLMRKHGIDSGKYRDG